ncbi:putative Isotrichodermin C-15 hydroxylase [Glarea lozoyensis 74030]|uniref:Putative Isotrichodermin C-15 hydroxylase n=1 Tax=Glarea lozoyensis (strain ATCC 74030 / MF5533) TaxID=1104152 RepID=H0ERJ5_GLAL7|nr:putative Isotrichodermin C-15 hydroxylase [Glarea lozoyensis 74030]
MQLFQSMSHLTVGQYAILVFGAPRSSQDRESQLYQMCGTHTIDIYGSHSKHIEKFLKADFISLGDGDQGITWEKDPIKHRHTAKKLSPAFSAKSIKAKESTIHKYVDLFVQKMKKIGQNEQGVELKIWTDWVSMDISAELSYSRELEQVEKMSSSAFLHALWGVNFFVNVHQILKKFPLSVPLQFLFVPPSALISGLPRVSPGAIVDGRYIEKGLQVQYGHFAFTRSPRYFHEPRSYRPQHWLPKDHPHWNAAFENDATSHYYPFGLGPRQCIGTRANNFPVELAWREMRIFVAKVLWSFDVEMVSDHKIVYERDFKMHRMWEKPEFWGIIPKTGKIASFKGLSS